MTPLSGLILVLALQASAFDAPPSLFTAKRPEGPKYAADCGEKGKPCAEHCYRGPSHCGAPAAPGHYSALCTRDLVCRGPDYSPYRQIPPVILEPSLPLAWVQAQPSQCANPWNGSGLPLLAFLNRRGVRAKEARTAPSGRASCAACRCPAGTVVYVRVAAEDGEKAAQYGFKPFAGQPPASAAAYPPPSSSTGGD